MLRLNQFQACPSPPPRHLSDICLLILKIVANGPSGANLRIQMSHGRASERVQMTNLWNKKKIIAHKLMHFYRICNSSNPFLTAKTATFSYTMHILLFVISHIPTWKQLCKYLHVGVEPYATFKGQKTKLFWTMHHPWADLLWQMLHREEGEMKKYLTNALGGDGCTWN